MWQGIVNIERSGFLLLKILGGKCYDIIGHIGGSKRIYLNSYLNLFAFFTNQG